MQLNRSFFYLFMMFIFSPSHHMSECSFVLKQNRWQKCVVVGSSIILLGTACIRATAPVISDSLNKNIGAFISTEFNRNVVSRVQESRIPSVIVQLSIFDFDSRYFNSVYRLAYVNSFS